MDPVLDPVDVVGGQTVHALLPAFAAYVPTAHEVHAEAPELEYVPAAHTKHSEAARPAAYVPASQSLQMMVCTAAANFPTGHCTQSDAAVFPVCELYFPVCICMCVRVWVDERVCVCMYIYIYIYVLYYIVQER